MPVYRVSFHGPELPFNLTGEGDLVPGLDWEASAFSETSGHHHRVLQQADGSDAAVARVAAVVKDWGSFTGFEVEVVRRANGEPWDGPYYRNADDIDWQAPARAAISLVQRRILLDILDASQPVSMIAESEDVTGEPSDVDAALEDLERQGIVESHPGPGREPGPARWWGLTDEGWELLEMIRSLNYG
jgi:hypothetical protein